MFTHEGVARPHRHNVILAGHLALVAGMVNSAGFIIIGSFTSHVTGNIGRLADDVALGSPSAASLAFLMVIAFFAGAFLASVAVEGSRPEHRTTIYGALLLAEAGLLLAFYVIARWLPADGHRLRDVQAMLLCGAMGVQNSLVTRLSGAVVRTTHLTGVVTDLGIEGARWLRHWRALVGARTGLRLVAGETIAHPDRAKVALLGTILLAFVAGSAAGALLAVHAPRYALLVPAALVIAAGAYALAPRTGVWRGFGRD